jgi:hypothetical protein
MRIHEALRGRLVLLVLLFALTIGAVSMGKIAIAASNLTVSPTLLSFDDAVVGAACPGTGCTYAEVTITNGGDALEHLSTATTDPEPPFFPTFGGSCNTPNAYDIPVGESCTFQFGFKPQHPGKFTGTGTINFDSGASVTVDLVGFGRHH